ncbi:MAG TPA: TolC family protein [Elusimicrobiota bacterium]|nr:TolC family protein [Elusimicrobiota bacterium]
MKRKSAAPFFLVPVLLLGGCAGYAPLPLPASPDTAAAPLSRTLAKNLSLAGLSISSALAQGLTEADVMALAVENDPDLKAARRKAGVAKAQIFAAGLLPDPIIGGDVSRSSVHLTGYNLSVSEDLEAFVLRPSAEASARANGRQADLAVLWQESQAAENAGELFFRLQEDQRLQKSVSEARRLVAQDYQFDQSNFQQRPASLEKVSADLAVLADADAQLRSIRLDADAVRHRLDYLLGLSPQARPKFLDATASPELSSPQFHEAIAAMARRRLDLLALQAGYESRQQDLRRAVLSQFPAPNFGLQWGHSNEEDVYSAGAALSFPLPVLNGSRGAVAVLRADRAALRQAYLARLAQAQNQADQIHSAARIMDKELDDLRAQTAAMRSIASSAEQSFRNGEMSAGAYVGLETSLLKDTEEAIRLHASLEAARLRLGLLLGLPLAMQENRK